MRIHPFERPTAQTVLADLGTVYGVGAPRPSRKHPTQGPGRGGSPPRLSNVRLTFEVGKRAAVVEIGTSLDETHGARAVFMLLVQTLRWRSEPRLPLSITVNHETVDLVVDGERHSFDAYLCRRQVRAVAWVHGKEISIECPASLLRKLEIKSLSDEELSEFFPDVKRVPLTTEAKRSRRASTARLRREPTPKQAFATLGVVYAPKRSRPFPASTFLGFERSGDQVTRSYLSALIGRRRQQVVVLTSLGPTQREPIINLLIHRVNTEARLDFPLDMTVRRELIEIPVDGQPARFTAYVCGDRASAEGSRNGLTISVDGPLEALRTLELTSLPEKQVIQMVQAGEEWRRGVERDFRARSN